MRERTSFDTIAEYLADRTKAPPPDHAPLAEWRDYVEARLEYAGCTIIAQISRVGPVSWRGPAWAISSDDRRRYPQPAPRAITLMDQAHGWIFQCIPDERIREVVGRRTLVIPDSPPERPKYLWTWLRLVADAGLVKSGPNADAMKRRWIAGVDMIMRQVTPIASRQARAASFITTPRRAA